MGTLLAQTFTDWEMIVCDSYSDDGSWELLQKFKGDPRIKLFQVPRSGLYAGWNECLQRAQGEYINIATSDDTASPNLLEKLLAPLEQRRDIHLSVCDFQEIDEQSRPTSHRCVRYREFLGKWLNVPHLRSGQTEFLANTVFITTLYTMAAVLFRRSLLANTGLFRTDQKSFADTDWALRASLATDIAYVPGQWTTFRLSPEQATPQTNTPEHWRIYIDSLSRVLDAPDSRIPEKWKQVPGWRDRLLRYRHNWYLDSFQLYRWMLKSNPGKFLSGLKQAAFHEPGWLAKQAVRALPPRAKETDPKAIDELHDLIRCFQSPWPPIEVSQW
jgi:glycosyltransferase involved in cell wall biosynthesis